MLTSLSDFPNFPEAKCTNEPLDFFFPTSRVELEERLPRLEQLCGSCIHQADCISYAIENEITDGYWAGNSAEQLKSLWKGLRK